ncbi:MAG TPA: sigma-70 family RNA polymerase sigma factor [Agriterribacter sp.]|nr:sigma-70 family RNA polymerase sigma factor [Chitinophagaceae bacterium]HRP30400.1 sigma-70 family RNA polymerase sigma factor [Agriterribacter sp.]
MQTICFIPSCATHGEELLWNNFRNGSRDAYAKLYQRYFDVLMASGLKFHQDKTLIEDCVHDLFVDIWNNKSNLSVPRSVKAYLLCAVQRRIFRQVNRNKNYRQFEMESLNSGEVQNAEKLMISGQDDAERQRQVQRAIKTLSRRQQEAVLLRFYADLNYGEIADKMVISTNAIYNLISKAFSRMSGELENISTIR